jgi:hypothetical protein
MSRTLSINVSDEQLARAERLAAARGITVEEMLERVFRVVSQPPLLRSDLPPLTRSMLGFLPPMTDEEVERVIDEERMRKYGGQ